MSVLFIDTFDAKRVSEFGAGEPSWPPYFPKTLFKYTAKINDRYIKCFLVGRPSESFFNSETETHLILTDTISEVSCKRLKAIMKTDLPGEDTAVLYAIVEALYQSESYLALVLNKKTGVLHFINPPGGYQNVFYVGAKNRWLISSRIALLPLVKEFRLKPNLNMQRFFLAYQFYSYGQTQYDGVKCLPEGHTIRFDTGATIEKIDYSPNPLELSKDLSIKELIEKFYQTFMQVLESQAAGMDPVGVMLGGFDSALIASGLSRLGKKVETYSFSYSDPRFNQRHIESVAALPGIHHHWHLITAELMRDGLGKFPYFFNAPVSQPHYLISTRAMADRMFSEGLKLCFTGDGCDGIFFGYPSVLRRARLIEKLDRLPSLLIRVSEALSRSKYIERKIGQPYRIFRHMLSLLRREKSYRSYITACIADKYTLEFLTGGQQLEGHDQTDEIIVDLTDKAYEDNYQRMAYAGKNLVGLNKNKLAGSAESTGLIIQSPYLHGQIKTFSQSLPDSFWLRKTDQGVSGKFLLAKMAEAKKLLPAEVIYQSKMSPVFSPVDDWYASTLREDILNQLKNLPLPIDPGFVDDLLRPKFSEKIYKRVITIDNLCSQLIGLLVTYALFYSVPPKMNINRVAAGS